MQKFIYIFLFILLLQGSSILYGQEPDIQQDTLVVLWTSGDRDVAEKSCLMYTHAAKKYGWFSEVILIIWGPSQKLAVEDEFIRQKLGIMQADGVKIDACIACSNMLNVTDPLRSMGVDVKGMGVPLSDYLKKGYNVLTY